MDTPIQIYRLLVVDDNPAIHEDFKKILKPHDKSEKKILHDDLKNKLFGEETKVKSQNMPLYQIDSAFDGEEGLKMIKNAVELKKPYALVFLDVLMPPGLDGIETMKHVWDLDRNIQVVICTAYSEYSWEQIFTLFGYNDNFLILKKPFESIEIRQLALCLTKKWTLNQKAGHRYDQLCDEIYDETSKLDKLMKDLKKQLD